MKTDNSFTEAEMARLASIDSKPSRFNDELPPADALAMMRQSNGSPKLACELATTLESEEGENFQYSSAPSWYPTEEEEGGEWWN